jgi:precorrin-6A/cobalt-precorrin-6A reductase
MRILILGGTAEARQLAERLAARAGLSVTLSLAGRTAAPAQQPVPVRVGGFGGVAGLSAYLRAERITALVDATHPFAALISGNAARAAAAASIPLLALRRPPWSPVPGDRWTEIADAEEAQRALGSAPRRVFLALGRQQLAAYVGAPQHYYLVRSVDPVEPPLALPQATYLIARGPFAEPAERALLTTHAIDVVIARNSGGVATYGKIAAARALGLEVLLLRRPRLVPAPNVASVAEAVAWLDHALLRADRGV